MAEIFVSDAIAFYFKGWNAFTLGFYKLLYLLQLSFFLFLTVFTGKGTKKLMLYSN